MEPTGQEAPKAIEPQRSLGAGLDEYTPAQLYEMNQALLDESVPTRPLIDILAPMSVLREEYENGSALFVKQIDWLVEHGYGYVHRARGDGDCFYRSLGFAYIENLINDPDKELAVASSLSLLQESKELLDRAGFEKFVYEDMYDDIAALILSVVKHTPPRTAPLDIPGLLEAFQSPETSNTVVLYLRFVTSAQMLINPDDYAAFITHPETGEPMEIDRFCNIVQAMGKEADNVEMDALCKVLRLNLHVAYLNGSSDTVDIIKFSNNSDSGATTLHLLYRPGHYDVLEYKAR